MKAKMTEFINIVMQDPAMDHMTGFTGGGSANSGHAFIQLKPLEERR